MTNVRLQPVDSLGQWTTDPLIERITKIVRGSLELQVLQVGTEIPVIQSIEDGESSETVEVYKVVGIAEPILIVNENDKEYSFANPQVPVVYITKVSDPRKSHYKKVEGYKKEEETLKQNK